MKANFKTNAMRILESEKIEFEAHHYDGNDGKIDGISVAEKIGQPYEKVYKTLVTATPKKAYYVFVIPVAKELDLKAAARAVGEKSVEMIKVADINKVTGYIRGGCSPIGMKKQYTTVIDSPCMSLDSMLVSAGRIGYQIELKPEELVRASGATVADICL